MSLRGKTIVVTRDPKQADPFIKALQQSGASAIAFPTISIKNTDKAGPIRSEIKNFKSFDWVLFTSANAVQAFFEIFGSPEYDINEVQIACVGKKTAEALAQFDQSPALIPKQFTNTDLLNELYQYDLANKSFLLPVSNLATNEIEDGLSNKGATVKRIEVYQTHTFQNPDTQGLIDKIQNKKIDCITFFSPSALYSFVELIGPKISSELNSYNVSVAVIGPATEEAAQKAKLPIDIYPEISDGEHLLEAIETYYKN